MLKYLLAHPAMLLWAMPFVLGSAVAALGKIEKYALGRLLQIGDAADQKAIRGTIKVWVVWAEEKYNSPVGGSGGKKFKAVNALLARAMPFLSADQREDLIEKAVKELDAEANAIIAEPPAPPAA